MGIEAKEKGGWDEGGGGGEKAARHSWSDYFRSRENVGGKDRSVLIWGRVGEEKGTKVGDGGDGGKGGRRMFSLTGGTTIM